MSNNLERLIRKIVKEAPMDFGDYQERPDPKTQRKIEDPQGIYAKNRAFRGGVSDVEKMTSKRFKEVVDYVKRYFGTQQNITNPQVKLAIQREQMRAVQQAMRTEPRYREQLRDLAVEIAAKEDGFLSYDLTMEDAINQGILEGNEALKSSKIGEGNNFPTRKTIKQYSQNKEIFLLYSNFFSNMRD